MYSVSHHWSLTTILKCWNTIFGVLFFLKSTPVHFYVFTLKINVPEVLIKYRQIEKSAVAAHYCLTGHELNPVPKLLRSVSNKNEMTMWENLLILKNKGQVMNFEIPPCDILSKKFILQPPDGGMSTPSGEVGSRNWLTVGHNALETCPINLKG